MTNPYEEDLVYLMGVERHALEIGTFPRIGKRLILAGGEILSVDETNLVPMSMQQWFEKKGS